MGVLLDQNLSVNSEKMCSVRIGSSTSNNRKTEMKQSRGFFDSHYPCPSFPTKSHCRPKSDKHSKHHY